MKKIYFCLALLLASYPVAAQADPSLHIVIYGDSLVSGYQLGEEESFAARLKRRLQMGGYNNVDVLTIGQADETSSGAIARFGTVLQHQPDVVILEFGNDVLRGVDPKVISRNLWMMVSQLKDANIYAIVAGIKSPASLGPAYADRLDAAYRQLATQTNVYPDILAGVAGHPEMSLADGIHPNSHGVELMVNNLYYLVDTGLRWKWQIKAAPQSTPLLLPPSPPPSRP